MASRSAVAGEHVSRENAADDVAKVGNVVDVGESGGDQHVPLATLRQAAAIRVSQSAGEVVSSCGYRTHEYSTHKY